MRYLSVCSGIEAATVAWHPLGWEPAAFAEIEKFPAAVLAHHYPETPNLGDMTTIDHEKLGAIDLLVGGTPCQSFSIAGLRGGMGDSRGNLALEFVRLALSACPRWVVWENVPGVLSSNGGRDFGSLLGALGEIGYGFSHRVLDAQYFGLAQRRKRVFVIGHLGDWRPAAAVLFERESLRGNPPPRRGKGPVASALTANGVGTCGADDNQAQARHLIPEVSHTLRGEGYDASEDGTGRGTPLIATAMRMRGGCAGGGKGALLSEERSLTLATANDQVLFVDEPRGFQQNASGELREGPVSGTLNTNCNASGRNAPLARIGLDVRRLTPVECERLQGFPDNYTRIAWRHKGAEDCPDGPRYRALGNSMAVPVMRWIGERINRVDSSINPRMVK